MIAVVALAVLAAAQQQTLWQNLIAGMTEAQVREAQPDATSPPDKATLHGGAVCRLHVPQVKIGTSNYRACFFFKEEALVQVTLNALGEPREGQFREIVTGLRAKYGSELSLEPSPLGYNADWLTKDGVNISVVFLNKYGNLLNINYQVRLSQDIKGL